MISLILISFFGVLIILSIKDFLFRKISILRSKKNLKIELDLKLKKKIERKQKLIDIDKANKVSKRNDQLFMKKREFKAWEDTNFDLFYDEEKILHLKRLEFKYRSKWKGVIYYASKKGAIYFISREGNKIYVKKS